MKALGDFDIGEYVRPIMPKFYVTGPYPHIQECGGMFLLQIQEYVITRKFEAQPRASRAEVIVEDGYRGMYCLPWHTPVLARYEAQPDVQQLAAVANKLHENNVALLKEYCESHNERLKLASNRIRLGKSRPGSRTFTINKGLLPAVNNLSKQAKLCVQLIMEMPGWEQGMPEADLMSMFRTNAVRFDSVQDAWRIFTAYLPEFRKMGLIDVEGEA